MMIRKICALSVLMAALLALGACGLRGDPAVPPAKNMTVVMPGVQ